MSQELTQLKHEAVQGLESVKNIKELETLRTQFLGKASPLTHLMKGLGALDPEAKKEKGALYNHLRLELTQLFQEKEMVLKEEELEMRLQKERHDMTLSPFPEPVGSIHPISQALFEALGILQEMGFAVAEGPDIEDEFHNFTALNIPEDHPARQEQDTFYLPKNREGDTLLLRTHTSPVQIRALKDKKPPIRIVAPGRVYRSDYDQTHTPTFHQIEGLYIAKDVHMGHLKGCLIEFCRRFFGVVDLPVRFRPGFFPFTEPSAEIDIGCTRKEGRMVVGGTDAWLEILGSGMIHPNVLKNMGLDPEEWQGFAFGMGVERIAMLKYGIFDLRSFYEGDIRWSLHYGFSAFEGLLGDAGQ
jgi:phenylalanyl-tRNA synthetase alpha chain